MKIFHKIDQDTSNELLRTVGLDAFCRYEYGVDVLNAGYLEPAYDAFQAVKSECERCGADIPVGLQNLGEAIKNAKSQGWEGDPEHWRRANMSFASERNRFFYGAMGLITGSVDPDDPAIKRPLTRGALIRLEEKLKFALALIEPAVKRDREIEELYEQQRSKTRSYLSDDDFVRSLKMRPADVTFEVRPPQDFTSVRE